MSADAALMRASRVVVTGGQGFIGRRVVAELAGRGADVVVVHRPGGAAVPGLRADQVPADLRDAAQVGAVLRGGDLLVHLAAQSGGIQFQESLEVDVFDDNRRVTRTVLDAARAAGIRRAFLASSAVVYAPGGVAPLREDSRLVSPSADRVSGYAWSKATDEVLGSWFATAGGFQVVIGRFTAVYGSGGTFDPARSNVVHDLVRKGVDAGPGGRLEVWGSGEAVRSFLHVEDAARAVVTVLTAGEPGGTYNLDASEPVSIAGLAGLVRDQVGGLELAFDRDCPEGAPFRVLDTTRLRALGFAPSVPLPEGVKGTVEAYRAARP